MLKALRRKLFIARLAKMAGSSCVLIENTDHELLVVKANYKTYWSPPGGLLDKDESPAHAAVRELEEEVGITVESTKIELARVIYRRSKIMASNQYVFTYNEYVPKDIILTIQASELDTYAWVSREDVNNSLSGTYNRAVHSWAQDEARYIEMDM